MGNEHPSEPIKRNRFGWPENPPPLSWRRNPSRALASGGNAPLYYKAESDGRLITFIETLNIPRRELDAVRLLQCHPSVDSGTILYKQTCRFRNGYEMDITLVSCMTDVPFIDFVLHDESGNELCSLHDDGHYDSRYELRSSGARYICDVRVF